MSGNALVEDLAQSLLTSKRTRTPIPPLSDSYAGLTEEEAYRIQDTLLATEGGTPIGYKLGFTSQVMREQMGVSGPNYGRLTDVMQVDPDVGPIPLSELIHPRVEPEIALLVERDLAGPGLTSAAVYPTIRWAFGAIEVVDSRYQDYRFLAVDNTADNSSAACFVLGCPISMNTAPDLRLAGVLLWRGGRIIARGLGADTLGGPISTLVWLANKLGEVGKILEAGSIVLTGGLTRSHSVGEGGSFVAEFAGLGTVKVHFD
jgi:2-keto-4-pentenoate hydratase